MTTRRVMRRGLPALLLVAVACASATSPRAPERPLFAFQSNFWLNLHLFARAVARGMPAPGELSATERASWDEGVAFYRDRYMDRDLAFDEGMVAISNTLRGVAGIASLGAAPLDSELEATLERLAPIYRAHWWPAHDAANRAWIAAVEPLLRRHGAALSRRIAASYGRSWPEAPIPVDLTVTAGPNGAYTTSPPTHTTIAPGPGYGGLASLEMLFHEASHAWGRELHEAIRKAAEARHKTVPRQLWHAVLFYNAGELTRRTLLEDGVAGYVEYAVQQDVYPNLCGAGCRELVAKYWDPHLAGKASLEEAMDGLVAAWPATAESRARRDDSFQESRVLLDQRLGDRPPFGIQLIEQLHEQQPERKVPPKESAARSPRGPSSWQKIWQPVQIFCKSFAGGKVLQALDLLLSAGVPLPNLLPRPGIRAEAASARSGMLSTA